MYITSEISDLVSKMMTDFSFPIFGSTDMVWPPLGRERKIEPVPAELAKIYEASVRHTVGLVILVHIKTIAS